MSIGGVLTNCAVIGITSNVLYNQFASIGSVGIALVLFAYEQIILLFKVKFIVNFHHFRLYFITPYHIISSFMSFFLKNVAGVLVLFEYEQIILLFKV
jgi:hypothetical protein